MLKRKSPDWWTAVFTAIIANLHALGVKDLDIMKIMRHSDVAVTRASYIKVPDSAKRAAMRKLDAALSARGRR